MNMFLQDVNYGFRVLMKNPAFTAIAVFSLALGVGINTAIFTLVNTILLGSLPYPEPDRVVAISTVPPQHPDKQDFVSVHDFMAWRDRNRSFDAMGAVVEAVRDFGADENGMPADRIQGENVTPGLLQALGVQPLMGRLFLPSEDEVDHPAPVMIVSYRLWQRRFGGDRNILSRTVLLNGVTTQIVGVAQPQFRVSDDADDFWVPIPFNSFQLRGSARFMTVIGRLKRGVSMQQAQADIASIAGELAGQFPGRDTDHGKPWGVRVQSIREALYGFMTRPLLLLQGAVGFVLLIACANVAALLLARASSRQTEVAIRSALGAGRAQIVRQFLTESVLLSLLGGVFGVLLAYGGVRALVTMAPAWFPRLHETVIDGRVLWFSAALALLTGLIFGVGPAMQGSKSNFAAALKDSARGGTSGATRHRLRGALVTIQLSLALVLLIGAGLLIRSFLRMQGSNLGYDPNGLLTFGVHYPEKQFGRPSSTYKGIPLWEINSVPADTINRIFDRIQRVPGVQSAGGSYLPPLVGALTLPFEIEGRPSQDADALSAEFYPITPNYFNTMRIALLRGRDFTARDTATAPWVAIVNETVARRFFANENPIGKRIKLDLSPDEQPRDVIAVAHDTPSTRLQTKQEGAHLRTLRPDGPAYSGTIYIASPGNDFRAPNRRRADGSNAGHAESRARDRSQPPAGRSENRRTIHGRGCPIPAILLNAAWALCGSGDSARSRRNLWRNGLCRCATNARDRHPHGSRRGWTRRLNADRSSSPAARCRGPDSRPRRRGCLNAIPFIGALGSHRHRSRDIHRGIDFVSRRGGNRLPDTHVSRGARRSADRPAP